MQLFYNLSDPAMEDALYEIESMRHFAGLKRDRLPDETTILKFRHFLERHGLGKVLFQEVNKYLAKNGLMLREGSIVDATIISAPSSTKNSKDKLGLIHSIETTAANVHDIVPADKLLHGEEQRVFGDAGYLGIQKRDEHKHRNDVSWYIAKRPGTRKQLDARRQKVEKIKASIRAKVEHPFRYIKQVFGYGKARYRGLAKNTQRLHLMAAFSNLLIMRNTYGNRAIAPVFRSMSGKGAKIHKEREKRV